MSEHEEEYRDNFICGVFAQRREGKSKMGATKIIPLYHSVGKQVIIVQPKFNPWYKDHPNVITTLNKADLLPLYKNTYNAAIIIEEARLYYKQYIDDATTEAIINTGQQNVDMFFLWQHWMYAPKDFYRICDMYRVMRCGDPSCRKTELEDVYDDIVAGMKKLKKKGDYFDVIK